MIFPIHYFGTPGLKWECYSEVIRPHYLDLVSMSFDFRKDAFERKRADVPARRDEFVIE